MRIGITGATGFLGRYLVAQLAGEGHHCRCWHRPTSDRGAMPAPNDAISWVLGDLGDVDAASRLVEGCDAVIHAALNRPGPGSLGTETEATLALRRANRFDRPGHGFMGAEGDLVPYVEQNVLGTIRLIEAARTAGISRFVFISTCAVHDVILSDRPLDETHPTWPASHYGAYKAAIEAFVHSYGFGRNYPICALRPTGIYGLAHPPSRSKWYDLIQAVARGENVNCQKGGKEVHAADVARAAALLLTAEAETVAGQAYNCCDRYISDFEVASIAKALSGSGSRIEGAPKAPKNQIVTTKIEALGMRFGGQALLEQTIHEILDAG
ncbi:MAG: NAD(P)-dependent oxidoreductase [Isosphaeraceae bacterium]